MNALKKTIEQALQPKQYFRQKREVVSALPANGTCRKEEIEAKESEQQSEQQQAPSHIPRKNKREGPSARIKSGFTSKDLCKDKVTGSK